MATITPKLTIASTTASGNEALGLSISKQINVQPHTISGISQSIAPISTNSPIEILESSLGSKVMYISHTSKQGDGTSASTKTLIIYLNGTELLHLLPGEFAFLPLKASTAVTAKSGNGSQTIMVEYACWMQEGLPS